MKKTLTTIAAAIIMISGFSAFAAEDDSPSHSATTTSTVNSYLEATAFGATEMSTALFTDDFQYSNTANGDQFNKKQYTTFLKSQKGVQFDCKTTYEVLDESGQAGMAKTTMVFADFTRVDYITLHKDEQGWKVSKVVTTYP